MHNTENIKTLCGFADDPKLGYAQITIDFFEHFENQFFDDSRNLSDDPIERDEVLAKAYEIGNILEIIDRGKFAKDVVLFQKMYKELHIWGTEIDRTNIILGIPRHKG